MVDFPMIDEGAKKLFNMIYTPVYTKLVFAGIELNVFTILDEAKSYEQVARDLELHPANTKYMLNALASIDLLEKNQGLFKNKPIANKYLSKNSDVFIGKLMQMTNIIGFDDMDIVERVKNGPCSEYETKQGLESHQIFGDYSGVLIESQRIGRAYEFTQIVSALPEFSGFKKMLDLGGGPGLIAMSIVNKHDNMKGFVFETPMTTQLAEKMIEEYRMQDRMEVLSGDFLGDSIGGDYDFILSIASLNFAKHDLERVIKKIYDSLNPGGVFMCVTCGLVNEETKPRETLIGWLPSQLSGCDFCMKQGEISDAALRVGFQSVYKRTICSLMGDLDVDIIRKAPR